MTRGQCLRTESQPGQQEEERDEGEKRDFMAEGVGRMWMEGTYRSVEASV